MTRFLLPVLLLAACIAPAETSTSEQALCTIADQQAGRCAPPGPTLTRQYTADQASLAYPNASPTPLAIDVSCSIGADGNKFCSVYVHSDGYAILWQCTKYPDDIVCSTDVVTP